MKEGLFAIILTSKGEITIQLEFEKTPGTVGNFAGLATGKIKNDIRPIGEPYYNGLKFHRVIKGFMAQAGDPNSKNNDFTGQLGQKSYGETIPAELIKEYMDAYGFDGILYIDKNGKIDYQKGDEITSEIGKSIAVTGPSDDVPRYRLKK